MIKGATSRKDIAAIARPSFLKRKATVKEETHFEIYDALVESGNAIPELRLLNFVVDPQRARLLGEESRFPRLNDHHVEVVLPVLAHQKLHTLVTASLYVRSLSRVFEGARRRDAPGGKNLHEVEGTVCHQEHILLRAAKSIEEPSQILIQLQILRHVLHHQLMHYRVAALHGILSIARARKEQIIRQSAKSRGAKTTVTRVIMFGLP